MSLKMQLLSDNHWRIPLYKERMLAKDWKKLLLAGEDKIIYRGRLVPLIAENLGYGVVEVSKDLSEIG